MPTSLKNRLQNWTLVVDANDWRAYKRMYEQGIEAQMQATRPAALQLTVGWRHIAEPQQYPCLVKTHLFDGHKTSTVGVAQAFTLRRCYHHSVYFAEAKVLVEATLRARAK